MGRKTSVKGANVSCKNKIKGTKVIENYEASSSSEKNEGEFDGKFSKRKLNSNWQQYDDLPIDSEDERKLDFGQFSDQKSLTADSHFSFTSEKNWELQYKVVDYFKLNIKDLQNEILCIPLHERLSLDPKLLNHEQVTTFESSAAVNRNNVKESLPLTQEISNKVLSALKDVAHTTEPPTTKTNVLEDYQTWKFDAKSQQSNCTEQNVWDESSENFFSLHAVEQELDGILSMPTTQPNYTEAIPKPPSDDKLVFTDTSEALNEDWLDSLLNDD